MARQLIRAAKAAGDTSVPGADNISHNIYRWERGAVAPAERYKLYYCGAFAIPFGQFGSSPPRALAVLADPPGMVDPSPGASAAAAYRGLLPPDSAPPDVGVSAIRREVLMAAHEGSEHAERAEQRGIGEATLEQFRADVTHLSVQYMTGETYELFLEMRRVRNRIAEALDRRQWPRDAAELYLLAGCLSALMAAAAVNLGYPEAAEELTRAGWAYATIIDHRPLMARMRLAAAYAAYWNGRPEQSASLARSGLEYLADGQNAAQLHLFGGLASARRGDAASARQAIAAARDARDREHHDELLEIGGEFGFSRATQSYYAGFVLSEAASDEAAAEARGRDRAVRDRSGHGRAPQPEVPAARPHRPGHRAAAGRCARRRDRGPGARAGAAAGGAHRGGGPAAVRRPGRAGPGRLPGFGRRPRAGRATGRVRSGRARTFAWSVGGSCVKPWMLSR